MRSVTATHQPTKIKEHIYLGEFDTAEIPTPLIAYKGQKHLLTFGPPGSGKSTSLCAVNLARRRRSIICFDPKGQLASITARRRREMGTVYTLDPFNFLPKLAPKLAGLWKETRLHWNPLAQLGHDPKNPAFIKGARAIAQAVIDREHSGGNSKFFDDSMEIMLTALCMWEAVQKKNAASLRNIREEVASDTLLATFKEMSESDIFAIRIAGKAAYKRMTDKTGQTTSQQDVFATLLKNTGFLDDDTLADDMSEGEKIDFARMHEDIITLYVVLPVDELTDQAKWLRMFVNLAMKAFLSAAPEIAKLPPVLFMLDEFGNIGRLPEILNVLNISRDLRLQIWFFLQSIGQLKASYEREWTYFFAGSGAITSFSARDWETASHISQILGKTEIQVTSKNSGMSWQRQNQNSGNLQILARSQVTPSFSSNSSTSLQVQDLIAPEDTWRLGGNGTINLVEPARFPARGIAPGYWDITDIGALDPNPYYHG